MSWRSNIPRRLPGVFHGRYRRHAYGGCGCSTILLCCLLSFVVLALVRGGFGR